MVLDARSAARQCRTATADPGPGGGPAEPLLVPGRDVVSWRQGEQASSDTCP